MRSFPSPVFALPPPHPEIAAQSDALRRVIRARIHAKGGWIPFAEYMQLALYEAGLGYYAAGAQKFGGAGDFVTAPELSPLFAQTLARQAAEIITALRRDGKAPEILEAGAGSGRLAADLLLTLEEWDALPERYAILEVSAELIARQKETLAQAAPRLVSRVVWRSGLPQRMNGLVLANELLDAMPCHCFVWPEGARITTANPILERGVALDKKDSFVWQSRAAAGAAGEKARTLTEKITQSGETLPSGYTSELSLAAPAWTAAWGGILEQGVLLLFDYGFPRREYYAPERREGTLLCHYRHRAHDDPFFLPGGQDITAHVDFSALIEAAHPAGLDLLGYTTQARFLLNCGLLDFLAAQTPGTRAYAQSAAAAHTLIEPQEMGEIFKVMALGKNFFQPLTGFISGDKSHTL
ncbi:MAG: SAM-dependent methyltransferase [Zoogloeaceae bacterium]|jgi:SAM-dependent MidA family methyltransferase|nr:SAM-dependent methyltransferase [Zoogloeaceae bacterium]